MAFGPGGAVVRNWLDNAIISPWIRIPRSGGTASTLVQWRALGGNIYSKSRIVRNWSLRGRKRIDDATTPVPGDSVECVSLWASSSWNNLSSLRWRSLTFNAYTDPEWTDVQVRFRVADSQLLYGDGPPEPFDPGPGPYIDQIRLGRRTQRGPVISTHNEAQDTFPSEPEQGHLRDLRFLPQLHGPGEGSESSTSS